MTIILEDQIGHRKEEIQIAEGSDIRALLTQIDYLKYDLYHTVNGKHKRFDFKLSEGDLVTIIPVLAGG